jgi:hypothetical protein
MCWAWLEQVASGTAILSKLGFHPERTDADILTLFGWVAHD